MYRTLIAGLLSLAGCVAGDLGFPLVVSTAQTLRDTPLVPDNKPSEEVQTIRNEIKSFYAWLRTTRQLLIYPYYAKFPEEREVDPISHLPIPKPKLSDLEMREKLGELLKEMPAEGDQGIHTKG